MTTMSLNLHLFSFIYYYFKLNKIKNFGLAQLGPTLKLGNLDSNIMGLGLGLGLEKHVIVRTYN